MIRRTLGLGWVLLLAFVLGFAYLVVASRGHRFLGADELLETAQATRR